MNVTGVILDSNDSRLRDQIITGLIRLNDETLIEKQVREMKRICEEIILVTDRPSSYLPVLGNSIRIITNYFKGSETLSAVHAALSLAKNDYLWIVTPDMPFLSSAAIEVMFRVKKQDGQLIIPECNGSLQLFHSLYSRSCIDVTTQLLEQDKASMMSLIEKITFNIVCQEVFREQLITQPFSLRIRNAAEYNKMIDTSQNDSVISI